MLAILMAVVLGGTATAHHSPSHGWITGRLDLDWLDYIAARGEMNRRLFQVYDNALRCEEASEQLGLGLRCRGAKFLTPAWTGTDWTWFTPAGLEWWRAQSRRAVRLRSKRSP